MIDSIARAFMAMSEQMHPMERSVLKILNASHGGIPQRDLLSALSNETRGILQQPITAPLVSRLLKNMGGKGLVQRKAGVTDSRTKIVSITSKGKTAAKKWDDRLMAAANDVSPEGRSMVARISKAITKV